MPKLRSGPWPWTAHRTLDAGRTFEGDVRAPGPVRPGARSRQAITGTSTKKSPMAEPFMTASITSGSMQGSAPVHFSFVSIIRAPTNRSIDRSFGKMQTTLVRRLTSRFSRSSANARPFRLR